LEALLNHGKDSSLNLFLPHFGAKVQEEREQNSLFTRNGEENLYAEQQKRGRGWLGSLAAWRSDETSPVP